jgi:hypothetical protein
MEPTVSLALEYERRSGSLASSYPMWTAREGATAIFVFMANFACLPRFSLTKPPLSRDPW